MAGYKVCGKSGCATLVERGGPSRCSAHRPQRTDRQTPNQQAYAGIGSLGRAWRRERAAYIRLHPICEWETGCLAPTAHVHHVDGEGPAGRRGLDHENFQGLCASHHAQEEERRRARDSEGRWRAKAT